MVIRFFYNSSFPIPFSVCAVILLNMCARMWEILKHRKYCYMSKSNTICTFNRISVMHINAKCNVSHANGLPGSAIKSYLKKYRRKSIKRRKCNQHKSLWHGNAHTMIMIKFALKVTLYTFTYGFARSSSGNNKVLYLFDAIPITWNA